MASMSNLGSGPRRSSSVHRAPVEPGAVRNRVLRGLSWRLRERLADDLHMVELARGQAIDRVDEPVKHLHFIEAGFASIVRSMRDGRSVEVGGIGSEGVCGVNSLLAPNRAVVDTVVQIPVVAHRLDHGLAQRLMAEEPAFRTAISAYARFAFGQMAQHAACNRLHSIEQRCCTWLLIAAESAEHDAFPLTHEALAEMLGGTRTGVTLTLGALKTAGLIEQHPGLLKIIDRPAMQARACECYAARQDAIRALFAPAAF